MNLSPDRQRRFAIEVVEKLRDAGHQALFAGGCVRDELLGIVPKDYDVATDATPERIREVFGRRRTVPVGAAFGVITVLGPKAAGQVEVATFREDLPYQDGRHPTGVVFSTPEKDAQRRDFTINALFRDPLTDQIIDYVGGQEDLRQGIVRAVGDPRQRLHEDRLRMLRAARFAATFGFQIEPATFAAIQTEAKGISMISIERIVQEMRRMLTGPRRSLAIRLLHESGLLRAVLTELYTASELEELASWQRAGKLLEHLHSPTLPLALATLLSSVEVEKSIDIAERWKLSRQEIRQVVWLAEHRGALFGARQAPWPLLQRILIHPGIEDLLSLHEAVAAEDGLDREDLDFCRSRLAWPAERLDPPPFISGKDLRDLGIPPGPQYTGLLNRLRDAQLDGHATTRDQSLELARRLARELPESGDDSVAE